MTERIKSLEEIKDPEGFLNAYYGAMEEARTLRETNRTLKEQVDAGADDSTKEEISKWKTRALKAEAKATLEAQGIKNPDRILKYLNLDGVDFDDKGDLTGLDDKVNEVKTDFPELFDAKKRAGRQSADIHAETPVKQQMTSTEAQVARLFANTA